DPALVDGCADVRDDRHLAAWPLVTGRAAVRHPDEVEHRLLGGRLRLLVPGQHRQDDRLLAPTPCVTGVECGRHVDDEVERSHRPGGERRVGVGSVEVPAKADPDLEAAFGGPDHAPHRVQALVAGVGDAHCPLQVLDDGLLQLRRHSHRADTLDVAVAPDGGQACAGTAQHPAHHRQIGDGSHVVDTVRVMGDAHGPGEDGVGCPRVEVADALDVRPGHAGAGDDLVPVGTADVAGEVLPPVGIEGSEVGVGAVFEYPLGQTGEQGDVATDVRLQVLVRHPGPEQQAGG